MRIIYCCLHALIAGQKPQLISRAARRADHGMITPRHHMDAIVAHGEIFLFAFLIIIVANAKAVAGADLKKIHFFVVGFARQIVHLVFVGWKGTPVAATPARQRRSLSGSGSCDKHA